MRATLHGYRAGAFFCAQRPTHITIVPPSPQRPNKRHRAAGRA